MHGDAADMAPPRGGFRAWFARRRPRWSVRTTLYASLGIVAGVTTLTLLVLHRPLWVELELVTALLSLSVYAFIAHTIFHGVRFDKRERCEVPLFDLSYDRLPDCSGADLGGMVNFFDGDEGCLGVLVGLAASAVLVVGMAAVLWLGLNVLATTVTLVTLPLFFIFRRSLRRIVAAGRTCRGDMKRSLLVGARLTALHMVWFYVVIYAAHRLHAWWAI